MSYTHPLLLTTLFSYWIVAISGTKASWTSKILSHPDFADGGVYQTRALANDGQGNMLLVLQKQRTEEHRSQIILTKVISSMEVLWTRQAETVTGSAFDITYDEETESAFVLVSDSEGISDGGRAHVIQFSNLETGREGNSERIREKTLFSTPANTGTTKLFGCVRHPANGNLYVTGGTSASPYRSSSLGKGDIIVVRLGASGEVFASVQFGSKDNDIGLSIAINKNGSALVVVAKRLFSSGLSTSEIYRLDPEDLRIVDGPHSPFNYGADPLFNPRSVVIIGPVASQPNTFVTFVGGDALVKPDRQADIYVQIYANIQDKVEDVTLTFDGAQGMKGIDSCISTKAGNDDNAYCLGYTETNVNSVSRRLNLIVISPTGELLFRSERNISGSVPHEETPVAFSISESSEGTRLFFAGQAKIRSQALPTVGLIAIPRGIIPPFNGFRQVVKGAGSITKPSSQPVSTEQPSIAAIVGAAAGGVAVIAVVMIGVAVTRRRRPNLGTMRTTRTNSTEEYTREVERTFTDAASPTENDVSRGALV